VIVGLAPGKTMNETSAAKVNLEGENLLYYVCMYVIGDIYLETIEQLHFMQMEGTIYF
jgi:hypothetical protein